MIDDKARASIEVKLVPSLEEVPLNADEAYRLVVNNGKVTVEAVTEHGVYWAMQTLAQLQDVQRKRQHSTVVQLLTGLLSEYAALCRM